MAMLQLTAAYAGDSTDQSGSQILNGQVDLHTSVSSLHATVDTIGGDVGVQSVAAGNTLDVTTMNDTVVNTNQYTSSVDISSDLGTSATNVAGSVSVQGQAICNSASVSTDPNLTKINNTQQCDAVDPTSGTYVYANNIGGDLSVSNLAAGNTFEADSNATNMPVSSVQINHSNVNAMTTATVSNVAGSVSLTSQAVGNSAQIIHYSTSP
jgi:hypothetical protein